MYTWIQKMWYFQFCVNLFMINHMTLHVFQGHLPGDVDRHILLGGTGEHPKQLIQDGRQELDHHMTFHGM